MSSEMQVFLDKYVAKYSDDQLKIRNIMDAVYGAGALGMDYHRGRTYTAREAFLKAEGNCLSFSYIIALMARKRGMNATFQEVEIPPDWSHAEDKLVFSYRHINVRIDNRSNFDYVLDIDRTSVKSFYKVRKMSDRHAEALYYSNKGVDFLDEGDMKNAFLYFSKALKLIPNSSDFWSNLGVFYRQNELPKLAERAYLQALGHKDSNFSALANLSYLYQREGLPEKSAYFAEVSRRYQLENPYYHFYRARSAYDRGNYEEAKQMLEEGISSKVKDYRIYLLQAEIYSKLGDEERAREIRERALR